MYRDIIRYSLISSVLPRITLETKDGDPVYLRSQINVLLNAPFGVGKTDILNSIANRGLGVKMTNWTRVAFLGTIRQNGSWIPPQTIRAAGSTVLVDEFQEVPNELKRPLLNLMEEQMVDRALTFQIPKEEDPIEYEEEFWSVFATGGYFLFKMKASWIIATSKRQNTHLDKMLQSRCIQINMDFDYDDVKKGISRIKLDDVEEIREEIKHQCYWEVLKHEDAKTILDYVVDVLRAEEVPPNYAYRILGDLIRIMNVKGLIGEDIDEAYDYLMLIIKGVTGEKLSPTDYEVLKVLSKPLSVREIMFKTGLTKEEVSKSLSELMNRKLVVVSKGKYVRRR